MTPRAVSKTIYPRGRTLFTTHEVLFRSREVRASRAAVAYFTGGRLPHVPYRVTYTLDPDGAFVMLADRKLVRFEYYTEFIRAWNPDGVSSAEPIGYTVCFLPSAWQGKRVRREVESVVEVPC